MLYDEQYSHVLGAWYSLRFIKSSNTDGLKMINFHVYAISGFSRLRAVNGLRPPPISAVSLDFATRMFTEDRTLNCEVL